MLCIDHVCKELIQFCDKYEDSLTNWCMCALQNYKDLCENESVYNTIFIFIVLCFASILFMFMRCRNKKKKN